MVGDAERDQRRRTAGSRIRAFMARAARCVQRSSRIGSIRDDHAVATAVPARIRNGPGRRVAAPVRRTRNLAGKARFRRRESRLQRRPIGNRRALRRRPGRKLRTARTLREIRVRLLGGSPARPVPRCAPGARARARRTATRPARSRRGPGPSGCRNSYGKRVRRHRSPSAARCAPQAGPRHRRVASVIAFGSGTRSGERLVEPARKLSIGVRRGVALGQCRALVVDAKLREVGRGGGHRGRRTGRF